MDRYARALQAGFDRVTKPSIGFSSQAPPVGTFRETSEVKRYFDRYFSYPRRIARMRSRVLHVLDHSYAHIVDHSRASAALVTVHDLLPEMLLQRPAVSLRERIRNHFLEGVMKGLKSADAWIVSTEWMRTQLAQTLGKEVNIDVIPYGVDQHFFELEERCGREELGFSREDFLILHVGSLVERKNFPALVGVVAGLRAKGVRSHLLQIGGRPDEHQIRLMNDEGVTEYCRFLGAISDKQLPEYYRCADILLFPSLYEGFGLPILEAMASGLAVVTSGAGGSAELAGDDAIVVRSREVTPFVEAVAALVDDESKRTEYASRGKRRATRFDWSHCVNRTLRVYERMLAT